MYGFPSTTLYKDHPKIKSYDDKGCNKLYLSADRPQKRNYHPKKTSLQIQRTLHSAGPQNRRSHTRTDQKDRKLTKINRHPSTFRPICHRKQLPTGSAARKKYSWLRKNETTEKRNSSTVVRCSRAERAFQFIQGDLGRFEN